MERPANITDMADMANTNFRYTGKVKFIMKDTGKLFTRTPEFKDNRIIVNAAGAPWVLKITNNGSLFI